MALAHLALCLSSAAYSVTRSFENDVDVHSVDSDIWIVLLLGEIRIITDSEGKISLGVKVPTWNGVVTDPEGVGQEFFDGSLVSHG